ncbi:hypothetical protein, partial [Eisenbergiella tayi]|uniref:hypothetical protein n=1 Tax=Eisenbergiella tayi TaxID=1432052 RepID=UPI001A9A5EB2
GTLPLGESSDVTGVARGSSLRSGVLINARIGILAGLWRQRGAQRAAGQTQAGYTGGRVQQGRGGTDVF